MVHSRAGSLFQAKNMCTMIHSFMDRIEESNSLDVDIGMAQYGSFLVGVQMKEKLINL